MNDRSIENRRLYALEESLLVAWPWANWCDRRVLVAVSGGADSVALLCALMGVRSFFAKATDTNTIGSIHVAHFNHGWRATDSDDDQEFVKSLCQRLSVPLHLGIATQCEQKEAVAREDRYAFLLQTAERIGARYLAVAHHADDQAETILHRIIRGTAVRGLAGIPERRRLSESVTLCRPLLQLKRDNVLDYLKELSQAYRQDPSNAQCRFTRNRIRHELLPTIARDYNPAIVSSLIRLGKMAAETSQYVNQEVNRHLGACVCQQSDDALQFVRERLLALPPFLQREVLVAAWREQKWPEQSMGFDQWERLVQAIQSEATICLPGKIRLTTKGDAIRLIRFDN